MSVSTKGFIITTVIVESEKKAHKTPDEMIKCWDGDQVIKKGLRHETATIILQLELTSTGDTSQMDIKDIANKIALGLINDKKVHSV